MLAPLLGKSVIAVADQLTSSSHYALLATALSPAAAKQVEDLRLDGKPLPGIFAQATSQRLYPGKTTGANVIGLVKSDGTGAAGIEYSYDSLLRGTDGSVSYQKDSVGNVNPAGPIKRKAATDGGTVRLTIDQDLQYLSQKYLDDSIKQSEARGGQVTDPGRPDRPGAGAGLQRLLRPAGPGHHQGRPVPEPQRPAGLRARLGEQDRHHRRGAGEGPDHPAHGAHRARTPSPPAASPCTTPGGIRRRSSPPPACWPSPPTSAPC